ncbi:hypothetical protein NEPTK9_000784 [Candidatus Neptunochlamydia vexilliferae]|uniref:Phosphoesterase HXTX domain-containing protein n=1 Tax=Candidatus Neptunichlamydia vexilliferae TaxID=1651774 RepID=A0ABS0B162_9BACT|nr:hypothetical protein [Candidatus Neptunochlamydia vexilliferae]
MNFSFPPGSEGQNDPYFKQVCGHFSPINLMKNRKSPHLTLAALRGSIPKGVAPMILHKE